MRAIAILIITAIMSLHMAPGAFAVNPDEILSDPKLEARARDLSAELRCLVCQNQSIDDSDAPLARDLRLLIRERLTSGDSNDEVLDFVVVRYGEFVLLRPVFAPHTWALWLATPVLFLIGAFTVWRITRRRHALEDTAAAPLSASERRKLKKLRT